MPPSTSRKIKPKCEEIEKFISTGDDDTVASVRDLCAAIVDDIDDITRDKLKGSTLASDVKARALAFRKLHPPDTAAVS